MLPSRGDTSPPSIRLTPRAAQRLSRIKAPDRCPHCNSKRLIKKGTRKKKLEAVPLFRCRACGRTFAPGPRAIRNKTYPLPEILEAFTLYDRGNRLQATAEKLSSRYGHRVAPSTISRWLAEHPALTTYRRLRDRGRRQFSPTQVIRSREWSSLIAPATTASANRSKCRGAECAGTLAKKGVDSLEPKN
jgi:transposase-like protein